MRLRIIFCVMLCVTPSFLFAVEGNFTRTLYIGMRSNDVKELQKVLNADTETRVAEIGPGSPGNETDYFGTATKRAIIKFQEKHRAEILAPVGLLSGTGIFGTKTRAKMNTFINSSQIPSTPAHDSVLKEEVIVMFPSRYSGKPGTMITISGFGFTAKNNTIYFGNGYAVENASSDGSSITFKIPSIPKGLYSLFVKNAKGESNKDSFFVVTDGITPEPKIHDINPSRATRGSTLVIEGSGFVLTENTIRAGATIVEHVSSTDGKSLSINIPADTLAASTSTPLSTKKTLFPVWVYVVNENGVSAGKSFELEL